MSYIVCYGELSGARTADRVQRATRKEHSTGAYMHVFMIAYTCCRDIVMAWCVHAVLAYVFACRAQSVHLLLNHHDFLR